MYAASHFTDAHTTGRYSGYTGDRDANPDPSFCATYSNVYDGASIAVSHLDSSAANPHTNVHITNANIDSGIINLCVDAGAGISWYAGDVSCFNHLSGDCFASGTTRPLGQGEC